ncbi:MAG: hypothetical protein K2P70_09745 [Hyphomonadaceae bacterium]|nr:hypothetical protein [Hyphomonadaceae bacterium]
MTSRILLAYPETAASQARSVAAKLGSLGYEVGALSPRARGDKVVMLWSRAAWGTPALRAAARRAHAAGKLVCIRLDSAPPPVGGTRLARLPRGRADTSAWRRLLHPKAKPLAATQKQTRAPLQRAARRQRPAQVPSAPAPRAPQESASMKEKNSRGFAIALTLTLLAIGATGYAYQHNAVVASRIDGAAASFYASASELAALAP